jgi:aspartate/methionine/tyrosine aminotransferase
MGQGAEPLVRLASRVDAIEPFYVMELMKEAQALERAGRDVIHMSIGEPDFTAPEPVIHAAADALKRGVTQYTNALGITPLREAIARHYRDTFGLTVDPERIVVTAGASAALLLACMALVDGGTCRGKLGTGHTRRAPRVAVESDGHVDRAR